MVKTPTHTHGNILDVVLVSNPDITGSTDVICPGLSDHCIVTTNIKVCTSSVETASRSKTKDIFIHRDADQTMFRNHMYDIRDELSNMQDVQQMWDKFSTNFKKAVDLSVPKKTIKLCTKYQPLWFNRRAEKLHTKQRKLYKTYKSTGNMYFFHKYKEQRRSNNKVYRTMKKEYIVNKVCKPLEKGNSKPFYKYIRNKQKDQHPVSNLKLRDGSVTNDNLQCAEVLNEYFHSQFCNNESISEFTTPSD